MSSDVSLVGPSLKVSAVRAHSDGFGIVSYKEMTTNFAPGVRAVKYRHQPFVDIRSSASLPII
jgi:hypothetical protein